MLGIGAKGRLERDKVVSIRGQTLLNRGRCNGSRITLCRRRAEKGQRAIVTVLLITEKKGESLAICREVEK